jgi:hypothetical protein
MQEIIQQIPIRITDKQCNQQGKVQKKQITAEEKKLFYGFNHLYAFMLHLYRIAKAIMI